MGHWGSVRLDIGLVVLNREAMGRARFLLCVVILFFNRAATGLARFLICTGFIFIFIFIIFSFVGDQTQTSTRPDVESRNL